MRKIDLIERVSKEDDKLLKLTSGGAKFEPWKLTCKDLKRLLEAFKTLNEIFSKCIVKESE